MQQKYPLTIFDFIIRYTKAFGIDEIPFRYFHIKDNNIHCQRTDQRFLAICYIHKAFIKFIHGTLKPAKRKLTYEKPSKSMIEFEKNTRVASAFAFLHAWQGFK